MNLFLNLLRLVIGVGMPILTIVFSYQAHRIAQQDQNEGRLVDGICLKCHRSQKGDQAIFAYTKNPQNPRQGMKQKHLPQAETTLQGTETHHVCSPCAERYVRHEIILQTLMVLPYPLVRGITALMPNSAVSSNFLLEIYLMVFSIAGAVSAWHLHRALRAGETPLAEIRDRVAIQVRKDFLGKNFGYYTRAGMRYLNK